MLPLDSRCRVLDLTLTTVGVIVLSPLFLLVAGLIALESKGSPFFFQTRVGLNGKEFKMFKFRSMYLDAEQRKHELLDENESDGVIFKMKNDPRVTRVGRVIRKLSIDELPQLLNVLKGEMSLVGPRPALPEEVAAACDVMQEVRLSVPPGITGVWQISGRSDLTYEQQQLFDLQYINTRGVLTNLKIIVKTIPAVLASKGAY